MSSPAASLWATQLTTPPLADPTIVSVWGSNTTLHLRKNIFTTFWSYILTLILQYNDNNTNLNIRIVHPLYNLLFINDLCSDQRYSWFVIYHHLQQGSFRPLIQELDIITVHKGTSNIWRSPNIIVR